MFKLFVLLFVIKLYARNNVFKRVIYSSLFNYFLSNNLFTPSQSGFLPGDSCIAQLLSKIHEIQTAFDENPTVDVKGI